MKKLKINVRKDIILSIIILFVITIVYLFNIMPKTLKTKKYHSNEYIFTGKYKLNEITLKQIDDLPNISSKLALKIYNYKKNIKKTEDFRNIKGVGVKKVEMLKKYIIIE